MAGKLYLCATPIGNLEDMTFRAIRILQEVDLIAAEDTRNSIKLLNHFEIHTPMTSYHEYNKYDKGRELVQKLLIDAEYTFDNNKMLFYFTADGRIDFRELVKDLAAVFKTRIELRQIGVRDETKILGGIGICGRPLCCHTYLSEFAPVSIKMAKEQNLSLNPTKISGVCGRLMCCLKNEQETYEYLNRKLPGIGDIVTMPDGMKGEVSSVNVLRQLVKVLVDVNDEKELREYPVEELKFKPKHKKEKGKEKKKDRNISGEQASLEEAKQPE